MGAPTTREILAYRRLERPADARWIEWAIELLVQGHDSPTLRVMAGEQEPFDSPEIREMTDRVAHELGFEQFEDESAAAFWLASMHVRQMLDRETTHEDGLDELYSLCQDMCYPSELMDFYSLHHALRSVRSGGDQYYWPGANEKNIGGIIDEQCRRWLAEFGVAG